MEDGSKAGRWQLMRVEKHKFIFPECCCSLSQYTQTEHGLWKRPRASHGSTIDSEEKVDHIFQPPLHHKRTRSDTDGKAGVVDAADIGRTRY